MFVVSGDKDSELLLLPTKSVPSLAILRGDSKSGGGANKKLLSWLEDEDSIVWDDPAAGGDDTINCA